MVAPTPARCWVRPEQKLRPNYPRAIQDDEVTRACPSCVATVGVMEPDLNRTCRLALEALAREPMSASCVGAIVWPWGERKRKGRVIASQGGGDYAAQMLLGRMRKLGLVQVQHGEGSSVWELTEKGKAAL